MSAPRFSWARGVEGVDGWAVKCSADLGQATKFANTTVDVVTASGQVKQVALGRMVTQANGGRAAWYATAFTRDQARDQRKMPDAKPKAITPEQVTKAAKTYAARRSEDPAVAELLEQAFLAGYRIGHKDQEAGR